jgi:hypothetical protein
MVPLKNKAQTTNQKRNGIDGSRTRNFRRDRAVLSPIELQSQILVLFFLEKK